MDFETIIQQYILPHWPFVVMAFILGLIMQPMKLYVWSESNAKRSRFVWWARAFLYFHPALMGGIFGLAGWYIWKTNMVASPGVSGPIAVSLYYAGAGAISSWMFAGIKYALQKRGIVVLDSDTPDMPPYPPQG